MTASMCDQVTERVALGEPLGELSEHVSTCSSCQGLVAVSSHLGATHHAVDPGLGFSARMTVGAQHLLVERRRRRLAGGLAATVAAGAFGVFLVARTPEPPTNTQGYAPRMQSEPPPTEQDPTAGADDDLAALVQLADTGRAARLSAPWRRIKKPLVAYRKLVEDAPETEDAAEAGDKAEPGDKAEGDTP
jgi:hypothetical protein